MTIAVTRNTPGRFHGFLSSCMLAVAPGVYAAPRMTAGVRERVWNVMVEWSELVPTDGGVVLFWRDDDAPSGMVMRLIGYPKKELVEHEGVWLTLTNLTAGHDIEELRQVVDTEEPPVDGNDPVLPVYRTPESGDDEP